MASWDAVAESSPGRPDLILRNLKTKIQEMLDSRTPIDPYGESVAPHVDRVAQEEGQKAARQSSSASHPVANPDEQEGHVAARQSSRDSQLVVDPDAQEEGQVAIPPQPAIVTVNSPR